MKLIFERSIEGYETDWIGQSEVPPCELPEELSRTKKLNLPTVSQNELSRHYTELANATFGVNDGFYPLGSCTMKYNPKINDEVANFSGFRDIHPLQPVDSIQGCLETYVLAEKWFSEINGMDAFTFQPGAGAHGELTALLMMKAYHKKNGDSHRNKIIIPDSAHGTNPASAAMAGFEIVNVVSDEYGCVDLAALKNAVGEDTAGLMLTNPNTIGIFDKNILEITEIIHQAGGLNYYDGANLNAIMGVVRPGDMGFDVVHLNIHKTFSTPHGGGGPGLGPVGCKELLKEFLPDFYPVETKEGFEFSTPANSIGTVKGFYGHFSILTRALTYVLFLGSEGISSASKTAVLHANYLLNGLKDKFEVPYGERCMHEFVLSLDKLKKETGVSALDMAKGLLDHRMHPPTMYFPLIVPEALMLEPTETESKKTMDEALQIYRDLHELAYRDGESFHDFPKTTIIGRVDEVTAARSPKIRYEFSEEV
ncbi:aminomethyl-transferring glycine dehydrogenase subunit GcvPB [Enterococcus sp. CWB-B31]|uniref:aminomethyl-transferring glycine dehydrogenase subunit GcvPB n=1 Tax=Enterococcus sp. CWB-B31 TaxID=2885159 RepID=UPI001E2AA8A8|nr:aminomethyl-transferring glycine dehydrogenase subunit GcvPB [Enterococcus sp. CWB-B31]MCB5955259.1 aminomethyl-transferring glycine dehydrogenase subunit GcvPB [Enterococcus sp. CWB-B31]